MLLVFNLLRRILFMAALRSRCGHYIFALWFLLSSIFFYFLAYSQRSQTGCLPYYTWCDTSANLECRSETCYSATRSSLEMQDQKIAKHGHHRTTCRAISSQLRVDCALRNVNEQLHAKSNVKRCLLSAFRSRA